MRRLMEAILHVERNSSVMLTFTRFVETFLTCIIPSVITMFVLSKKSVVDLMYAMYFAGMFLCLCVNGFFWFQFMNVLKDWNKFLKVNLSIYLLFAAVMIGGFYLTDDPRTYSVFFGVYRALEFFGIKTIISLVLMNALSVGVMPLAGKAGMAFDIESHHHDHSQRGRIRHYRWVRAHRHMREEHERSEEIN